MAGELPIDADGAKSGKIICFAQRGQGLKPIWRSPCQSLARFRLQASRTYHRFPHEVVKRVATSTERRSEPFSRLEPVPSRFAEADGRFHQLAGSQVELESPGAARYGRESSDLELNDAGLRKVDRGQPVNRP
jgi:hypothetical protein